MALSTSIARVVTAARGAASAASTGAAATAVGVPGLLSGFAIASDATQLGVHPALACLMVATGVVSSFAAVLGGRRHDRIAESQAQQLAFLGERFESAENGRETRDDALHAVLDAIATGQRINHADAKNDPVARLAILLLGSDDAIDAQLQTDKPLHVSLLQTIEQNAASLLSQIKDGGTMLRRVREELWTVQVKLDEQARQLDKIERAVSKRPYLSLPLGSWTPTERKGNPFVYSEQRVPFVGRWLDRRRIDEFLWNTDGKLWTIWTGEAGMGKSRLAYEVCVAARAQGWDAGFLSSTRPFEDWTDWRPSRDTLIVIDYVAERPEASAQAIGAVLSELATHGKRVRFLLLERSTSGSWWGQFQNARTVSGSNAIVTTQFGQEEHLRPLDEASLRVTLQLILDEEAAKFTDRGEEVPALDAVYAKLIEIDRKPPGYREETLADQWRPRALYAALFAQAVADVGLRAVQRWKGDDLLSHVLREEARHWPSRGVNERHIHALTLATLSGSLPMPIDTAHPVLGPLLSDGLLPNVAKGDRPGVEALAAFAGPPDDGEIPGANSTPDLFPLRPDILGERMVLDRLGDGVRDAGGTLAPTGCSLVLKGSDGATVAQETRRMVCAAWRMPGTKVREFIFRAVTNFATHPAASLLWLRCGNDLEHQESWAGLAGDLVGVLFNRGRFTEAHELLWELESLHQAVGGGNKPIAGGLSEGLNWLGQVLSRHAQYADAFKVLTSSARLAALAFGSDHPEFATRLNNIGGVLKAQGDLTAALASYRQAERIDRAALGDNHPNVATRINNIGSVLFSQGDLTGALSAFLEAERIDRAALGDGHPNVATRVNNIGSVLKAQGDLAGALASYREAERIDRAALGNKHPDLATDINNIGSVLFEQGDPDGAINAFREVERIFRAALGDVHPNVATVVNNIGGVLQAQDDIAGALAAYREAERIDRSALGNNHPNVATTVNNIGSVLRDQGDFDGAATCFEEGLRIFLGALGPKHSQTVNTAMGLVGIGRDPLAIAAKHADAPTVLALQIALVAAIQHMLSRQPPPTSRP